MALRLRRGTDAERLLITPVEGELIYTTDTKKLYAGDGSTAGGNIVTGSGGGGGSATLDGLTDTDSLYVSLDFFDFQTGITEDFQQQFLPEGWLVKDHNGNGTWLLSTTAGGYSNSSQSTFFNNYDIISRFHNKNIY